MTAPTYFDGFVAAVPTADREAYRAFVERSAAVFRRHGALGLTEGWGEDVPEGELTSLPMAVKREAGETVVFSWVLWPDKATRDAGWQALMADPEMADQTMPFDGKRMVFGGFEVLLTA